MGKVTLNLAISLDGHISRVDGAVDFLTELPQDSEVAIEFNTFLKSIRSIIMGRLSYEKTKSFGTYPFSDKDTYVLSRVHKEDNDVYYTDKDITKLVEELKPKGDIWLFGGSNVITQFINLKLVDELYVTIAPIIIGKGIPLFKDIIGDIELELVNTIYDSEMVTLKYNVK